MNSALDILKRRKALNSGLIDKLLTDTTKVKLPYLYFLPDVSKVRNSSFFSFYFHILYYLHLGK